MNDLLQDVRYFLRTFKNSPTFAFVVVLGLALAIGANTAIFSLLNAVLLRSLPYAQPDSLAIVWEDSSKYGFPRNLTSPANYKDLKEQNNSFDQLAATRSMSFNLTGAGDPEEVEVYGVTSNLFSVLGVAPTIGRDFQATDDHPGANKVAIVSHELWKGRYGGDAGLLNQKIYLDEESYTVIGMMPPGFDYPEQGTQIWVPAALTPSDWGRRTSHFLRVIGRFKEGITLKQAKEEMDAIAARLKETYPNENANFAVVLVPLREQIVGNVRVTVLVLVVAIACVLLITCSNTANLMLVRTAMRRKEIAVRAALGANRSRLIRQLLTESLMLAVISGGIGLLLAPLSFGLLKIFIPEAIATGTQLKLDLGVLAFTLVISLLTAVVFGTVPALQASRLNLVDAINQGGDRSGIGGRSRRLQQALMIIEVSLAVLLLIGAALMIQTYSRLRNIELGIKPEGLLTMRTSMTLGKNKTPEQGLAFFQEVLNRVRALPGVESAAYINYLPLTARGVSKGFLIQGRPAPDPGTVPLALFRPVSDGYFETVMIPLIKGRYFDRTDGPKSHVAVINVAAAKKFWPGEEPIGQQVVIPSITPPTPITIVGVVGDVKETGVDADFRPALYLSYLQFSQPGSFPADLAVRTKGDPSSLTSAVRGQVWAVDSNQPISKVRTMEEIVESEVKDRKVNMLLLSLFASIAIIQAMLGIYGVLASIVAQRTREIGLRMALGATPPNILRTFLGRGIGLVLAGVAIGLGASIALTRFVASLLYGVSATDPLTFVVASLGVIMVSMIAIYVPARRAMKIDPMTALRLD